MTRDFMALKRQIPELGIGLTINRLSSRTIFENSHLCDFVEIIAENYLQVGGVARSNLEAARTQFPIVSHGVTLSIGGTDPLNKCYLKSLRSLIYSLNCPYFSDHLSFSSVGGVQTHDLLPIPFTKSALRHTVERIKRVQDFIEKPFLLENISYYTRLPDSEMTESQFIGELLEQSDCGLLLDINNVFVNSENHQFNCEQFILDLPPDRIVEIHMAGHKRSADLVIDTHGENICKDVFSLFQFALGRTAPKAVILEREVNWDEPGDIVNDINFLRSLWAEHLPHREPLAQENSGRRPCPPVALRCPDAPCGSSSQLAVTQAALVGLWMGPLATRQMRRALEVCEAGKLEAQLDPRGTRLYEHHLQTRVAQDVLFPQFKYCAHLLSSEAKPVFLDYLRHHPPIHFRKSRAGDEFLKYLRGAGRHHVSNHPWLEDMADFEWHRFNLRNSRKRHQKGGSMTLNHDSDFKKVRPVLNPALVLKCYRYPIARIAKQLRKTSVKPDLNPTECHMVMFMEYDTYKIRFMELDVVACSLMQKLKSAKCSVEDLFQEFMRHNQNQPISAGGENQASREGARHDFLQLMRRFEERGALCGYVRVRSERRRR